MKSIYRVFVTLIFAAAFSLTTYAQDDIDKLVQEGIQDGEYLLEGYLNPFMKSLSLGLNQGWYNTAQTHKVPGFDLTVTVSGMFIPDDDLFYYVDNDRLTNIELEGGSGEVPTIFGPDSPPTYVPENGQPFDGPGGIDIKKELGSNILPVPIANLGIGLPKGIDLKIRYAPTIDLGDDATFKLIGFGVMHDVKQYIPGIKFLPIDLSAFVGYTNMKLEADLSGNFEGENQKGVFEVNSTTVQGVISKKFSVITFYGGLGYNIAKSNLSMNGTYDFDEDGNTDDPNETNPVDLRFAASGPRMTAGFRLKLGVIALHADYTLQSIKRLPSDSESTCANNKVRWIFAEQDEGLCYKKIKTS